MSKLNDEVTRAYCYFKNGQPHCPLADTTSHLKDLHLFNSMVEEVGFVDIDNSFVCDDKKTSHCRFCPFNFDKND